MGIGLVAVVVLGWLAFNRPDPAPYTPPAEAAATTTAPEPARVLVVGDSYTGGSAEGGTGARGWPALVDGQLDEVAITTTAAGGSGYVNLGPGGTTFADLTEAAPDGEYELVVFFGSRNDDPASGDITAAVGDALGIAAQRWPEARLLVIGPPWVDGEPPTSILENRDEVQAAAQERGARFVDPLSGDGWFGGTFSQLIGEDGVHPTDEGHARMAALIAPVVAEALGG